MSAAFCPSSRRLARQHSWPHLFLLLALASLLVGCAATGKTLLEKGESFNVGRSKFDAYFNDVAELRDKVKSFDSDLFPVREPLVEEMDLNVDISLPMLMVKTSKRVVKLKNYGVTLNLRLTPNPIVVVQTGELEKDEKDEGLLKAVQESSTRALSIFREYQQLLQLAAELDAQRNKLAEQIDKLPARFEKKDLIEVEIVGAGRVLQEVERKLLRDTRTLSHFLLALASAVDTGAAEAQDTQCAEALAAHKPKRRGRGRGRGRPGGRRPGGGRPKPPTKPAGGDDFDM